MRWRSVCGRGRRGGRHERTPVASRNRALKGQCGMPVVRRRCLGLRGSPQSSVGKRQRIAMQVRSARNAMPMHGDAMSLQGFMIAVLLGLFVVLLAVAVAVVALIPPPGVLTL